MTWSEKILVLDFGGQYTQLIAKAVRNCNVFSEIKSHDFDIREYAPSGIILSGGPDSVFQDDAPKISKEVYEMGIPVLGICYGMQLTNFLNGGKILHGDVKKEYGETPVYLEKHPLFSGLEQKITAWMSHGDSVGDLAPGFRTIARTDDHIAAIADEERRIYGVQFHPEVTHTQDGKDIISNFVHDICGCSSEWTMANFIDQAKDYIRDTVGSNDILAFCSGGVDSTFASALAAKTEGIGNVHVVYIEGLMRKDETEEVKEALEAVDVKPIIYRVEDEFIEAVAGMSDPEQKRKAIGNQFGVMQSRAVKDLGLDPENTYLLQGTLYTDKIESGKGVGKSASNIKSHHNVGCPFIEKMEEKGRLVEPNRWIFKDEVRKAATEFGLPENIAQRQPFPGPGLGIRIVDSKSEWVDEGFYKLNDRVAEMAADFGLQGYALPVKTVGVQGDERTYSYLAMLKGQRDWGSIRSAAKKIPMEIHDVNRVVYEIAGGDEVYPGKTISTKVKRDTIDQLKDIDHEGRDILGDLDVSQTIFVLFGSDLYDTGKRSVALRAVKTDDFMTVSPAAAGTDMSWDSLDKIYESIRKYDVGAFFIDVTDKPPATTCWE